MEDIPKKDILRNGETFLKVRGSGLKKSPSRVSWNLRQFRKEEGRNPSNATLGAKGKWLSNQEHRVDALALRADERRDKLRKAAGSCT